MLINPILHIKKHRLKYMYTTHGTHLHLAKICLKLVPDDADTLKQIQQRQLPRRKRQNLILFFNIYILYKTFYYMKIEDTCKQLKSRLYIKGRSCVSCNEIQQDIACNILLDQNCYKWYFGANTLCRYCCLKQHIFVHCSPTIIVLFLLTNN